MISDQIHCTCLSQRLESQQDQVGRRRSSTSHFKYLSMKTHRVLTLYRMLVRHAITQSTSSTSGWRGCLWGGARSDSPATLWHAKEDRFGKRQILFCLRARTLVEPEVSNIETSLAGPNFGATGRPQVARKQQSFTRLRLPRGTPALYCSVLQGSSYTTWCHGRPVLWA